MTARTSTISNVDPRTAETLRTLRMEGLNESTRKRMISSTDPNPLPSSVDDFPPPPSLPADCSLFITSNISLANCGFPPDFANTSVCRSFVTSSSKNPSDFAIIDFNSSCSNRCSSIGKNRPDSRCRVSKSAQNPLEALSLYVVSGLDAHRKRKLSAVLKSSSTTLQEMLSILCTSSSANMTRSMSLVHFLITLAMYDTSELRSPAAFKSKLPCSSYCTPNICWQTSWLKIGGVCNSTHRCSKRYKMFVREYSE
mmetsp:Transcript_6506/g.9399  ORF Transcript_6506/g.9399 Transcript_6506/m.9399 type:complete len:254 (-) Transcript_6506:23-784(-)